LILQKTENFITKCDKLTVYDFAKYPEEIPLNLNEEEAE